VPETPVLEVRDARVSFGGLVAVADVSLTVTAGEVVGLVGPNGAGKTTLFNAISGLVDLTSGTIDYRDGADRTVPLHRLAAWRRSRLGIGRTFQDSRLIEGLPVVDQLAAGAFATSRPWDGLTAWARTPGFVRRERQLDERAREVLEVLGLVDRISTDVALLSAPERRLVDLGRALLGRPSLLLLDEIGAGMPPEDKTRVVEIVRRSVEQDGTTVVLVEHDMRFVRSLAHRVVVMAEGSVIAHGAPDAVLRDPAVLEAYIGGKAARSMT
jgi:ABC-type branched-subunit amino acid transport system ATPase component